MSNDPTIGSTPKPAPIDDQTVHEFEPQPPENDQRASPKATRKAKSKKRPEPFSRAYVIVAAVAVIIFFGLLVGFLAMIVLDIPWIPVTKENKASGTQPSASQSREGGGVGLSAGGGRGGGRRGNRSPGSMSSPPSTASSAPRNQATPAAK
jgi:hypothetical protein